MWNAVTMLGVTGETLAPWLDLNRTTAPLARGDWADVAPAHLAASAALWILIPLLLGVARASRKDVK
ncbi:hypothetical protein [Nonomuraea jabiensis]|uniref:hypothetical protein n=1 Tax=Nonomuraea jabiensis TaxID=882448 RepID=UPI003681559C